MLARLKAFILGVVEFRSDVTTSFRQFELACTYDAGRELAHRLTLRRWDR